jgi:hypothetical protein
MDSGFIPELGRWELPPELPASRIRAVLAALVERIDMRVDQFDIRLSSARLSALSDVTAAPSQSVTDVEIQILSMPVRLCRAGREIRMLIDGTDPFRRGETRCA